MRTWAIALTFCGLIGCETVEKPIDAGAADVGINDGALTDTTTDVPGDSSLDDGALADASRDSDSIDSSGPDGSLVCPRVSDAPEGIRIGRVFPSVSLRTCSGDTFIYPMEEGCEVIVILKAAAWCAPCVAEARVFRNELMEHFASRPVRFLQVLLEDDRHDPTSEEYCQRWSDSFDIPPENIGIPGGETSARSLFLAGTFPATIIVGKEGQVVFNGPELSIENIVERVEQELQNRH